MKIVVEQNNERKHLKKENQESASELEYRSIFQEANEAIFVHDISTGAIVDVNEKMCEMYGYSRDEALELNIEDLGAGTNHYSRREALRLIKKAAKGETQFFEWLTKNKEGKPFWTEVNLKKVTVGERELILATVHDVTKRKDAEISLAKSEEKYRLLAENVRDVIWTMDPNLKYTYVSPSVEYLRGYKVDEVMKQSVEDVLSPASLKKIRQIIAEETAKEKRRDSDPASSITVELELKCKGGSTVWTEVNITPIRDKNGAIKQILGITRDITERKKAQTEISRLAAVIEQAGVSIIITDLDGKIVYTNPFFEELTGYNREEVLGKKPSILKSGKHDSELYSELWETITHGKTWKGTFINKRKDGSLYYEDATIFPIRDPQGKIINYAAVKRDITEKIQAAKALKRSEKKYCALVQNSLTGIYIVNQQRQILFVNREFAKIFGYPIKELIGMDFFSLVIPDHRHIIGEFAPGNLQKITFPTDHEVKCLMKDGQTIWIRLKNTCIDYGEEAAILGNAVNITDQRKMQQALLKSEKELRMLSSRLLIAQEEERKRIARELHDSIGQTLTASKFSIDNTLDLLDANRIDEGKRMLKYALSTIHSAIEETRKISMGLRPSILDDLGIVATVSWFCREFNKVCPHIEVEKRLNVSEDEISIPLKTTLFRVLQEALNNVAKHSHASKVSVELSKSKDYIEFSIRDNGIGFDIDKTLNSYNHKKGFGLASMKERTEFLKGRFSVRSTEGEGTTVKARWRCSKLQGISKKPE